MREADVEYAVGLLPEILQKGSLPVMPEIMPGRKKMKKLLIIAILILIEILILVFAARRWPVVINRQEITVAVRPVKQISCEEGQRYIEACVRELYKCERTKSTLIGL